MKITVRVTVGLIFLLLASLGCQSAVDLWNAPTRDLSGSQTKTVAVPAISTAPIPSKTAKPTQTIEVAPTPTQESQIKPLFSDDFSNPASGWPTKTTDSGSMGYHEGRYRIEINRDNYLLWALSGHIFSDVRVEAYAAMVAGGEENTFGLICRFVDPENFYALVITSDGKYAIRKRFEGGSLDVVSGDGYQASEAIFTGQAPNHIEAQCVGDTIKLLVNGQLLAAVVDNDLPSGDAGVIAGTFEANTTEVEFDDFIVELAE